MSNPSPAPPVPLPYFLFPNTSKPLPNFESGFFACARGRIRTHNPLIRSQMLCPLSYAGGQPNYNQKTLPVKARPSLGCRQNVT